MTNSIKQWVVKEPWIEINCKLGEGPWYSKERSQVRFLDIMNHMLYTVDLNQGPSSLKGHSTGTSLGVTADIEGSEDVIVAGSKEGFAKFDLSTAHKEILARFWPANDTDRFEKFRSNDGACDSHGRFWVGVFNDPEFIEPQKGVGVLFRFDPDGSIHEMCDGLTIPNGLQWNEKDDVFYMVDGPSEHIWQWTFDAATGAISNKQPFFKWTGPGEMDGNAFDEEGCLWQALYGGSKVLRISPEGKVIGEILLPTKNITCPCFVGTELILTTAADKSGDDAQSTRYGGSVFKVDVGVKGRPKNKFRDLTK